MFGRHGPLHCLLKLTATLRCRDRLDVWFTMSAKGETEAPGFQHRRTLISSLTSPVVLAKAMRSRLGDQAKKIISCGSCFSPTTRKDGKQVGKRSMGAALQRRSREGRRSTRPQSFGAKPWQQRYLPESQTRPTPSQRPSPPSHSALRVQRKLPAPTPGRPRERKWVAQRRRAGGAGRTQGRGLGRGLI